MPSMTQNFKFADGSSDSEQSFINVLDERPIELGTDALLDNGIYATFARLYDIVAEKNSLEAELDDLFAKRRAHVLEVLEKSRRRLEFIDKEEKQMKNMVKNDCFKEYKACKTSLLNEFWSNLSAIEYSGFRYEHETHSYSSSFTQGSAPEFFLLRIRIIPGITKTIIAQFSVC